MASSPSTLELARELGELVNSRWRARRYHPRYFSEIAVEAIRERPIHEHFDPCEVLQWVLSDAQMPTQLAPDSKFGQPPVTAYSTTRFAVDFLYWLDATTAVHDHGFDGAFQVMHGSSLHGEWSFAVEDDVNDLAQFGVLRPKKMEILKVGDCRPILAGNALIHSLFHMAHPSVSLVVRTHSRAEAVQREYFAPSFAETSFRKDLRRQLQNESLLALRELDREKFESELRVAIERREPAGIFDLLRVLHDTEADRAIVVEAARPQLGDRIDQLLHAISELKRRSSIAGYRAQVRNPEHRFFLAILANAPNREYFLNLVAGAYPESRPVDTVLRWIDELAEQPLENEPTNNAFGLPIDGGYTDILKLVMEDFSLADVLKRLEKEFSNVESQREAVTEMYELVRHESIFSVLFPR